MRGLVSDDDCGVFYQYTCVGVCTRYIVEVDVGVLLSYIDITSIDVYLNC